MDKNLVDWYSCYLISRKDKLQSISKTVVADAFFFKKTFVTPMCENGFSVISRFRNDVVLVLSDIGKENRKTWSSHGLTAGLIANLDLTWQGIRGEQRKKLRIEGLC